MFFQEQQDRVRVIVSSMFFQNSKTVFEYVDGKTVFDFHKSLVVG